jgi:peptide/nickel transport system permease protein
MTARRALAKFLENRRGRLGVALLAMLAFVAVFADWIAGDAPVVLLSHRGVYVLPAVIEPARFAGKRADAIAAALAVDESALWPLWRSGPSTVTGEPPLAPASGAHPFGTDAFGRDVFARLVYGTRTALLLGLLVTAAALVLGCALGGLAGMKGGLWDSLIERMAEVIGVFPAVVVIALLRALEQGSSIWVLAAVVALVRWAEVARLTRVLVLRCLGHEWAVAALAGGASHFRVFWFQLLPHLAAPLLVSATFSLTAVVLTETSLSFLGLGVPAPTASWGEMLGEVRWGAGPRVLFPPAAALGVALASLYLIADAARKSLEN